MSVNLSTSRANTELIYLKFSASHALHVFRTWTSLKHGAESKWELPNLGRKQAIDWYLSYLKQQIQTDLSRHIQYVIHKLTHSQYEEVLAVNHVLCLASSYLLYTHILAWLGWNAAETCNFCSVLNSKVEFIVSYPSGLVIQFSVNHI